MTNITIKQFRQKDLEPVKELVHRTIDICYSAAYPAEAIQYFKKFHSEENIMEDAINGYTVIMGLDGNIIGTGTIIDSHIKRVFVEPKFQKQGFGKMIMGHLEEKARDCGIKTIQLDSSNVSKKFYEDIGYITVKDTFITLENNQRLDYYEMEKTTKLDKK